MRRADRYVSNQRMQEERINFLSSKLKQEFQMKELAKFENKNQDAIHTNFVKQRMTQMREAHAQEIEAKRAQLRNLLAAESEQYKAEIKALQGSPEQTREKMFHKMQELKTNKEAKRQQEVTEKLDRRFREGSDELRKMESDLGEMRSAHFRNLQMVEKQQKLENQYQEDMVYAELWKRDAARKAQREQEEYEDRMRKNEERNQVLKYQTEQVNRARVEDIQRNETEKRMLNQTWKEEGEKERLFQQRAYASNKELNRELYEHNVDQKRMRESQLRAEKDADRQMIQSTIERERMMDALEREERERQKAQTRDFLNNFKNRSNELHSQEAELERLVQEEMDKQHRRQQDQWKKEEDARVNLMYNVYDSRAQDIQRKQNMVQEEKVLKGILKQKVNKDMLDYEEEIRRKKEEEWRRNRSHQDAVLGQVYDKTEVQRRMMQERADYDKSQINSQADYIRRIHEEKARGIRQLNEMKMQRPY